MKVAICTPVHGETKALFTKSLVMMVQATLKEMPAVEFQYFMTSTSSLCMSRTSLFLEASNWGADFLLWADADHTFPPDALIRLIKRLKQVVGVNYPRRDEKATPTAAIRKGDVWEIVFTTPAKKDADLVEEVDSLGFGLCLLNMRALGRLGSSPLPLFAFESMPSGEVQGEDAFFFSKLRQAGIRIYCDHALSWEVGHLFEYPRTNLEAVVSYQVHKSPGATGSP